METEEKQAEDTRLLDKIESRFQELDARLDAIDEKLSEKQDDREARMAAERISDEAIRDDIAAYKQAIDDLKETRINIYRYSSQKDQEAAFSGLNDIRQMVELLKEMKDNSEELVRQCDYMKETQGSLQEIGNNEQLFQLLDTLRERMVNLGGCDEKIKTAAETAMQRVSTMEEVLNQRLEDANRLETELMDSSKELRETASSIDAVVKAASEGSMQDIQEALVKIQQDMHAQVDSMDQSVQGLIVATKENTGSIETLAQGGDAYKQLKEAMAVLKQVREALDDKTYLENFEKIKESHELNRFFAMLQRKLNDDEIDDAYRVIKLLVDTCNLGHKIHRNITSIVNP